MSDLHIQINGKKRLLTKGKFCDKNILITAQGGNNDEFWDVYQEKGNKTNYSFAFSGKGWNDETFKPKYDIAAKNTYHLFSGTGITDLVKLLSDAGVCLDLSQATSADYLAQGNVDLTTLPTLDLRGRVNVNYLLYDCNDLQLIEKVILKDDGLQQFNLYSFRDLPALEEIRFEGKIGQNGFNIQWSKKLSRESLLNIIEALQDKSQDTSGVVWLVTLGPENLEKLTENELAIIENKGWQYA